MSPCIACTACKQSACRVRGYSWLACQPSTCSPHKRCAFAALQVCYKLDPTMFSNAEKQQLPMERCMRILPHQQVRSYVVPTPRLCVSLLIGHGIMVHAASQYVSVVRSLPGRARRLAHSSFMNGALARLQSSPLKHHPKVLPSSLVYAAAAPAGHRRLLHCCAGEGGANTPTGGAQDGPQVCCMHVCVRAGGQRRTARQLLSTCTRHLACALDTLVGIRAIGWGRVLTRVLLPCAALSQVCQLRAELQQALAGCQAGRAGATAGSSKRSRSRHPGEQQPLRK